MEGGVSIFGDGGVPHPRESARVAKVELMNVVLVGLDACVTRKGGRLRSRSSRRPYRGDTARLERLGAERSRRQSVVRSDQLCEVPDCPRPESGPLTARSPTRATQKDVPRAAALSGRRHGSHHANKVGVAGARPRIRHERFQPIALLADLGRVQPDHCRSGWTF